MTKRRNGGPGDLKGAGEERALRNGRDGARPSRASANQDGTAGGWEGPAPSGAGGTGVCTMRLASRKALAGPGDLKGAGEIRALRNGRDGARPSRASAKQDGTAGGWEGPAPSGPGDHGVCTMRLTSRKALGLGAGAMVIRRKLRKEFAN